MKYYRYHVHPTPTLNWKTHLREASAQFSASADFSVSPSITFHLDNFFQTTYSFKPVVYFNAQGSTVTKEVCANMTYDLSFIVDSQLSINIPFIDVHSISVKKKKI